MCNLMPAIYGIYRNGGHLIKFYMQIMAFSVGLLKPVSHGISPPPPPPPPPINRTCYHNITYGMYKRRFAIEGEGLPYGIISPWESSAMGFLQGERLPYGIISGGRGGGGVRGKNSHVTPAPLSKQVSLSEDIYYHGFGDLVVT